MTNKTVTVSLPTTTAKRIDGLTDRPSSVMRLGPVYRIQIQYNVITTDSFKLQYKGGTTVIHVYIGWPQT